MVSSILGFPKNTVLRIRFSNRLNRNVDFSCFEAAIRNRSEQHLLLTDWAVLENQDEKLHQTVMFGIKKRKFKRPKISIIWEKEYLSLVL